MKGMQKIKRGSGFLGVLSYATSRDAKAKWDGAVIGGNMLGISAVELATEFGLSRRLRPDIERPVWHNSLRLPQGDKASIDEWAVMADDYMQRMGFSEHHQRVYILHDPDGVHGQHIHIIASRIGLSGEIYLGKNENLKSTKIISQLERDYGLTMTRGVNYDSQGKIVMPAVAAPSKSEMDIAIKRGERSERIKVKDVIDAVMLDGAISASDFCDRLAVAGIRVLPNISELTGGLSGFSFGLVNSLLNFSGSKIGADYKLNGLERRGLNYVKERDFQQLAAIARRLREYSGARETAGVAEAGFSNVSRGIDRRVGGGDEEHGLTESNSALRRIEGTYSGNFQNEQPVGRERADSVREILAASEVDIRRADKAGEADEADRARANQGFQDKPSLNSAGTGSSFGSIFDPGDSAFSIINKDDALRRIKARLEARAVAVSGYFLNISKAVNLVFCGARDEFLKLYRAGGSVSEASAESPVLDFIDLGASPNRSMSWDIDQSHDCLGGAGSGVVNNDLKKNKMVRSESLSDVSYSI
ncbi:relaxase/mobilization nuclease domain-containing protein [Pseudomonas shirazica]|uniref:relaxase/mobilization nuclease domain-containing protein n=1 Tax=Pseudomonas shirazica TaxID=1940636 RepID=UPI0035238027